MWRVEARILLGIFLPGRQQPEYVLPDTFYLVDKPWSGNISVWISISAIPACRTLCPYTGFGNIGCSDGWKVAMKQFKHALLFHYVDTFINIGFHSVDIHSLLAFEVGTWYVYGKLR